MTCLPQFWIGGHGDGGCRRGCPGLGGERPQVVRADVFADISANLQIDDEDFVRVRLVAQPDVVKVLKDVRFTESTPAPGEVDGSDKSFFVNSYLRASWRASIFVCGAVSRQLRLVSA